jgi:type IV secretion system protein VirD4
MTRILVDIIIGILQVWFWLLKMAYYVSRYVFTWLVVLIKKLADMRSTTHGSARWAKVGEFREALKGQGLIIGKIDRKLLRYTDPEGLILLVASTSSGKGVGFVIPNLLDYQGSVLCLDPKGENYAITKRQRADFGKVYCINIEKPERSSHFNPLDTVRVGTLHEVEDAERIADLLLVPDNKSESHWRDKSRAVLVAFILYVLHKHKGKREMCHMTQVRAVSELEKEPLLGVLKEMAEMPQPSIHQPARRLGEGVAGDNKEILSILSNMEKGTRPFAADRVISQISRRSDFSFNDMNAATKTVYIIIPEGEAGEKYAPYMRLLTGLAIEGIAREGKQAPPAENRPLLMLDELATLGYLEPLEKGVGYLRAYARAVLVFQDLKQIREIYPKAESIIANSHCQIYFGVNDLQTAEQISRTIGAKTVLSHSEGLSQAHDAIMSHQQQAGKAETRRDLLDPSEVMRLEDHILIFWRKMTKYPIKAKVAKYYQLRKFQGQYDKWR